MFTDLVNESAMVVGVTHRDQAPEPGVHRHNRANDRYDDIRSSREKPSLYRYTVSLHRYILEDLVS